MTQISEDWLVLLDFEPTVPCDGHQDSCDNPVAYRMTKECCASVYLFCQQHAEEILQNLREYRAFDCTDCKAGNVLPEMIHINPVA